MSKIRFESKRGQMMLSAYRRSEAMELRDVYVKCSFNKEQAFERCEEMCKREGGRGLRITGANCHRFSVGWMTDKGLRVETACNSYLIVM